MAHDTSDSKGVWLGSTPTMHAWGTVGRGGAATRRVRLGGALSRAGHRHSHDGGHGRPVQGSGADVLVNQGYGYTNGRRGSIRELPQMPRADWFRWRQHGKCWPRAW